MRTIFSLTSMDTREYSGIGTIPGYLGLFWDTCDYPGVPGTILGYNKLQFGIRIRSIVVSKQKLHISMSATKHRAGNHPGATPCSRAK